MVEILDIIEIPGIVEILEILEIPWIPEIIEIPEMAGSASTALDVAWRY